MSNRVLHWIPNVDLRCKFDGLAAIVKKECGINVQDLRPGEFAMCINTSWTQIALFGANNCIMYHRNWDGSRLNPKALKALPAFVSGQDIGYRRALDKVIREEFAHTYPNVSRTMEAEWSS